MYGRFICYEEMSEQGDLIRVAQLTCIAATEETLQPVTMRLRIFAKVVDILLPVGEQIDVIHYCIKAGGYNG